jgi:hypothetical protein
LPDKSKTFSTQSGLNAVQNFLRRRFGKASLAENNLPAASRRLILNFEVGRTNLNLLG